MKRILAVRHADGTRQAICPKCDTPFDWTSTQEGDTYGCPNCGMEATPPEVEYDNLAEGLLYATWLPVYHEYTSCPECGGRGECIVNEMMIDVRVRIFTCNNCDSFWRVEE